jgi:TetR/AcrR family transcriptional repressor of nem operon
MKPESRKNEILDVAQDMIQKNGFNGFSYADIASIIGIRKASIHHHFMSKAELGVALVQRYRESFNASLEKINTKELIWLDKIRLYGKLYANVLKQNKLCLCGMMASEIETLPPILKDEIRLFFQENVNWLRRVLKEYNKTIPAKKSNDIAWQIISSLQGAVMLARMQSNDKIFNAAANELYTQLTKQLSRG